MCEKLLAYRLSLLVTGVQIDLKDFGAADGQTGTKTFLAFVAKPIRRLRRLMRKQLAEGSLAVEKVKHGHDWSDRASFPNRY
jgi:hypothetical protein